LKALLSGGRLSGAQIEPSLAAGGFVKKGGGRFRPDALFPIIHGSTGEDGVLQGLLELLGIPYAGCGVTASAVGMDKVISKVLAALDGVPVLPHVVIREPRRGSMGPLLKKAAKLGFPLFVKPVAQGSSVGVAKVKTSAGLRPAVLNAFRFDAAVLIEKGVDRAREIVCGVLGSPAGARASVTGEVVPKGGHEFFDYEAKYLDDDGMDFLLPAPLSTATSEKLRELSVKIFLTLGGSGMARVDFLVDPKDERKVYFCEINTLPGFTSHSLYPRLWEKTGLKPERVLKELVRIGVRSMAARRRLSTLRK
jgi:D-alanine-D-alanine ligase